MACTRLKRRPASPANFNSRKQIQSRADLSMQRFAVPPQARNTNYPETFAARVCKPNHPFVESRGAASSDKPMSRACAGRRPAGGPVHLDRPKDEVHLTAGDIRMKHSVHRSQMRAMSKLIAGSAIAGLSCAALPRRARTLSRLFISHSSKNDD